MPPQPPGVGITHMVDPTLHAGIEFGKADAAGAPGLESRAQAPGGMDDFASFHAPVSRVDDQPEPGNTGTDRRNLGAFFMDRESQVRQAPEDGTFSGPELGLGVGDL